MKWVAGIEEPVESFHLYPAIKTRTPNGHFVTWYGDHIIKHFHTFEVAQFERMKFVHELHLSHIEHGEDHKQLGDKTFEVTITRVGIPLLKALDRRLVTRSDALRDIKMGVQQLHAQGFAHTDLHINNVFWDTSEHCVFLDDLEYLTPVDEQPRDNVDNPNRITNARLFDLYQVQKLESGLG